MAAAYESARLLGQPRPPAATEEAGARYVGPAAEPASITIAIISTLHTKLYRMRGSSCVLT